MRIEGVYGFSNTGKIGLSHPKYEKKDEDLILKFKSK